MEERDSSAELEPADIAVEWELRANLAIVPARSPESYRVSVRHMSSLVVRGLNMAQAVVAS